MILFWRIFFFCCWFMALDCPRFLSRTSIKSELLKLVGGFKNNNLMTFRTLPSHRQVLNLTRTYITRHQTVVVSLIEKYAEEWRLTGNPIYRPMWWLSPSDPMTFTIDDQFLIGDEVTQ